MDLVIVASHPIQYQACVWRELSSLGGVQFEVWYGSDYGTRPQPSAWGPRDFTWDVDLTTGYPHRFLPNWSPSPAPDTYWGKLYPGLALEILRRKPRAVLVQGYRNLHEQSALLGAKLAGSRVLFRADTNARGQRGPIRSHARRRVLERLYPMLDAIFAIGPDNRRHYEEHGVPNHKLYDAPYAVDLAFFNKVAADAKPRRAELRQRLGLPMDRPVVLFAGVLRTAKAVDVLVRALARLPDVHLAIAGSGPEHDSLEALGEALAPGRVHFLGFLNQTELARAYAAADVFCLPSRFEPWGLVANEALAMGTPVVVTEVCGVAADVRSANAGLTVPPESPERLADALDEAIRGAKAGRFDTGMGAFNERHHPRKTAEAIARATFGHLPTRRQPSGESG